MKRNLLKILITTCASLTLAACGGGGSGDAPAQDPIVSSGDPVAITLDNAQPIAGKVAGVALGDGVFGALSGVDLPVISGLTGVVVDGAAKIVNSSQMEATSSALQDCAENGTVDVDVTVTNPFQPTLGDVYAFQFAACDDGVGVVTDGGMILTITDLDGDFASGEFLLGVTAELSAFSVTGERGTTGAQGTVGVVIDTRTPPVTTITVSTSGLATTSDGTAEAVTALTVTTSEDESAFPTAVSVDTSFAISSPSIGGEVAVSTSVTLQASGDSYPYVGELRITGAGNSVIVLIALGPDRVRLEIDVDGDGAFDGDAEMTWDELLALTG